MKKILISIVVILFGATSFVSAQSLDDILKNYFEALGQETLLASKTSQTKGKMIQMGMEIPFMQYSAAPDKFRVEATFQDMTLIQTYNGKEGWSLNPFAGMTEPMPMSADELKSARVQADYEGMLWNWEKKGYKVTLEENEEVEGAECFVVKCVSADGDEYTTYFDAESYVPLKVKNKVKMQGQDVETETYMSNYQEGDGYVFAGKIETRMNGQVAITLVIDEMILGGDFEDSFFEKPVK